MLLLQAQIACFIKIDQPKLKDNFLLEAKL